MEYLKKNNGISLEQVAPFLFYPQLDYITDHLSEKMQFFYFYALF